MIQPWVFEFFHQLRGPSAATNPAEVQEHFRWYGDLWVRCEARGFQGIFFSEHHFGAAYSPSPNLLVANLAARTTTLRLGVLGTVSPYATPWRVVEEFAMLDQLTGGRVELGVVSGIPPELATVGISAETAEARHAEILDVVDAAIAGGPTTHHGSEWQFDNLQLLPPFLQQPPPLWTASRGAASAERAGSRGWRACLGFLSTADLKAAADAYRAAAANAGHPSGPDRLAVRRLVKFTTTDSERRQGVGAAKRALLDLLNVSAGGLPPWAALLDQPDSEIATLSNEEFVAGTPAQVAEQLVAQCQTIGTSNMAVCFSATDKAELDDAHAAFAADVNPALRAATISPT